MKIDKAHYHSWEGKLQSPWYSTLAIVRVALLQVMRRKLYWIVFLLGLLNFLMFFSLIYAKTQFTNVGNHNAVLERFDFSPEPPPKTESGYISFIDRQSMVVMILLAFCGSLVVGADFRTGALPFYLSRRINRRHYIVGKLLAISGIIALLTAVPALILYIEYGMFASSMDYFMRYGAIPISILGYVAIMCVVLSILLFAVSAYLQRLAPIAITWASAFVLLGSVSKLLERSTGNEYWLLLDPWRNIRSVGRLCFGFLETAEERQFAWIALGLLTVVCSVAMLAIVHRVRAIEVVE